VGQLLFSGLSVDLLIQISSFTHFILFEGVEPAFDTKNPEDLLSKLKYIETVGGGDCPEYAISGLKVIKN
jgi:hypothetical protein